MGCDIDVALESGVALLTGEVPPESLRSRAARLARMQGVTRVDNRITVQAPQSVADKTRKGVDTAVSKTGQAVDASGEVTTDGWITTKVKAKLVVSGQ